MTQANDRPDRKLIADFIDSLTPPNDEMDVDSALILLERAGVDLRTLSDGLKERLEREVRERRARNEEVPNELLELLKHL